MKEQRLIEALKNADTDVLRTIYVSNRVAFVQFARAYNLDREEVLDIYQDAIIALRENAINGKLDSLRSSIKTYLFGIGKYMIYTKLKEQKRVRPVETIEESNDPELVEHIPQGIQLTEEKKRVLEAFELLGERCKQVLTLFYYRGFTLEEIAKVLQYNSTDVVKSQKSRCLRSIKDHIAKTK